MDRSPDQPALEQMAWTSMKSRRVPRSCRGCGFHLLDTPPTGLGQVLEALSFPAHPVAERASREDDRVQEDMPAAPNAARHSSPFLGNGRSANGTGWPAVGEVVRARERGGRALTGSPD